jgi:hypothetical protein
MVERFAGGVGPKDGGFHNPEDIWYHVRRLQEEADFRGHIAYPVGEVQELEGGRVSERITQQTDPEMAGEAADVPILNTYLLWREVIKTTPEFDLTTPEEILLMKSRVCDNGFLEIVKQETECETYEQLREWIQKFPDEAALLDKGVRVFEIRHKLALHRLTQNKWFRTSLSELLARLA